MRVAVSASLGKIVELAGSSKTSSKSGLGTYVKSSSWEVCLTISCITIEAGLAKIICTPQNSVGFVAVFSP